MPLYGKNWPFYRLALLGPFYWNFVIWHYISVMSNNQTSICKKPELKSFNRSEMRAKRKVGLITFYREMGVSCPCFLVVRGASVITTFILIRTGSYRFYNPLLNSTQNSIIFEKMSQEQHFFRSIYSTLRPDCWKLRLRVNITLIHTARSAQINGTL